MRKYLILVLVLAVALTACVPQAAAPAATTEVKPAAPATETPAADAAQPAAEAAATQPVQTGPAVCTPQSNRIEPNPKVVEAFGSPTETDWAAGPADAPITIIEYSDFQCPYCSEFAETMIQLREEYPDTVRVIFRHFPLEFHDKAMLAAQGAEAAGKQGKFFEYGDALFATQSEWADQTLVDFEKTLTKQAEDLKLDMKAFAADLKDPKNKAKVEADRAKGIEIGIPGTPFTLINMNVYQGPRDLDSMKSIIDLINLESRQFAQCPEMTVDPTKDYTATIKTEKGEIVMKLFADKAPMAVNSFIFLARSGWFDDSPFHRVIPGFVAQGGDPSGSGMGGPGYYFGNEANDLKFDKPGMVGMANSGPDTNGSQFFIAFNQLPQLDGGYTIFAQVVEGLDVAGKLTERVPEEGKVSNKPDRIITVTIEEK